jgi:amino acid transporter
MTVIEQVAVGARAPETEAPPGTALGTARAGFGQLFVLSLATLAPATVLGLGPAVVMATAGAGTWLSYVGAAVVALSVGICVTVFARRRAVSGSLYSYVGDGLGRDAGFLAGWGLLIGYVGVAWAVVAGVGAFAGSFLTGVGIEGGALGPQAAVYALIALAGWALAVRGVQEAASVTLAIQALSLLVVGAVLVAAIADHGISIGGQLRLEGASLGDVGLGMTLTFISFVGFESSAALGAEARDPHRAVPRLLRLIPLALGAAYVAGALLQVPVLGGLGEQLAAGVSPVTAMAEESGLGGIGGLLDLAMAASFLAASIALLTCVARVVHTMASDGVLPRGLAKTHPRLRTPHVAIAIVSAGAFLAPTLLLAITDQAPIGVFMLLGTPGAFGFLAAYVLVAVAAVVVRRRERGPAGLVGIAALVAAAGSVWTYVNSITHPAPAPFDVLPYVFAGLMAAGLCALLAARRGGAR